MGHSGKITGLGKDFVMVEIDLSDMDESMNLAGRRVKVKIDPSIYEINDEVEVNITPDEIIEVNGQIRPKRKSVG